MRYGPSIRGSPFRKLATRDKVLVEDFVIAQGNLVGLLILVAMNPPKGGLGSLRY